MEAMAATLPRGRRLAALVAVVLAIAAAVGGYALGHSSGADLKTAGVQGTRAGKIEGGDRGSQAGYTKGFEQGFRQARPRGYRDAFYKTLSKAGVKPAQLVKSGVAP